LLLHVVRLDEELLREVAREGCRLVVEILDLREHRLRLRGGECRGARLGGGVGRDHGNARGEETREDEGVKATGAAGAGAHVRRFSEVTCERQSSLRFREYLVPWTYQTPAILPA